VVKKWVENQVPSSKTNRFMELEGLRVIAAVVVAIYHMWLIFYPGTFLGIGTKVAPVQNMRFEDNLFQTPLLAFLSGNFAVGIFFVLSGFVLSVGFFKKKDPNGIKRLASKRYLRLMLPAAASIMIGWLLVQLGTRGITGQVGDITHSGWLLAQWPAHFDFFRALWEGAVEMFASGEVHYNSALWTINYELTGSFIVFGSLLLFGASRYRWLAYFTLTCLFLNSWLLGFIAGMVLADLYVNREGLIQALNRKVAYVFLAIGITLGAYPIGRVVNPFYKAIKLPGIADSQLTAFYVTVGAILVVISVLAIPSIRKVLSHRWISGFGKYTYSFYLVHMPTLLLVCTSMFLFALPIGFHKASLIAIAATLVSLVPLTYLFEKYVDAPSIRFSAYCANVFLGQEELDSKKKLKTARSFVKRKLRRLRPRRTVGPVTEIEMD